MELPQKHGRAMRPINRIIITLVTVALIVTMMAASTSAADDSNEVAATHYTLFSDVPSWAQDSIAKCIGNGFLEGTGTTESGTIKLDLSHDFVRTIVLLDRAGFFGDIQFTPDESWFEPVKEEEEVEEIEISQDRTSPIYEVYKDGFFVDVSAEMQWTIHDVLVEYDYEYLEKTIFGLAVAESTFTPTAYSAGCYGLYQIMPFWINGANITHFTDDYKSRSLYDPHDATLTLLEMWEYAINAYGIDTSTDQGIKDLLYWHNTGTYRANINWSYSNMVFRYANELVSLQD